MINARKLSLGTLASLVSAIALFNAPAVLAEDGHHGPDRGRDNDRVEV
jgi:hypothetical protein